MPSSLLLFSIITLARRLRFSEAALSFSSSFSCLTTRSFFYFLMRSISWIARALATDFDPLYLELDSWYGTIYLLMSSASF